MRYLALTAARTRTPLAAIAAAFFALFGVFADRRNDVGATWGLTAVLCCGLSAWIVGAVLDGEPRAQADMASVALGGRASRDRLEVLLVLVVTGGLTVAFLAYPLLLGLVFTDPPVFSRPVELGDVVAGALAHLTCGCLGGAIAILFAPPRVVRRATAIGAVLGTLLLLVALSGVLRLIGGPVAVATALTNAAPGSLPGRLLVTCGACIAVSAAAFGIARRWARTQG